MEKDRMWLGNQVAIANLISHIGLERSSPLSSVFTVRSSSWFQWSYLSFFGCAAMCLDHKHWRDEESRKLSKCDSQRSLHGKGFVSAIQTSK